MNTTKSREMSATTPSKPEDILPNHSMRFLNEKGITFERYLRGGTFGHFWLVRQQCVKQKEDFKIGLDRPLVLVKKKESKVSTKETVDRSPILSSFNLREWIAHNFPNRIIAPNDMVDIYNRIASYTGVSAEEVTLTCYVMNEDFKRRQNLLRIRNKPTMDRFMDRNNHLMKFGIKESSQSTPTATEIRNLESIPNGWALDGRALYRRGVYCGQSNQRYEVVPPGYTTFLSID